MSTKTETDSTSQNTIQYDPQAKGRYDALQGAGSNQLLDMINNPFGNPLYRMGLGQSVKGAQQGGANLMGALQSQMKTSGLSGQAGNAFQAAQQGKIGRATQSMVGQANIQNTLAAYQRMMQGTGMALAYNPLMTGEKGSSQSTETKSGLGTWLPQLAGAALGGLTGGFGGAFGSMFGSGGGTMAGGAASGGFGLGMPFPQQFQGFGAPSSFSGGSPAPNPFMMGGGQF